MFSKTSIPIVLGVPGGHGVFRRSLWQRSCMTMKENAVGNTTLRADLQVEETRAELRRN